MKNQFILLLLLTDLAACSAFKPASRNADNPNYGHSSSAKTQTEFIDNISTGTSENKITNSSGSGKTAGNSAKTPETQLQQEASLKMEGSGKGDDDYSPLQFKFAILTNCPVEQLTNLRLLVFMDQWYGVPYHYGGSNKEGIDCSAFASLLISSVYDVNQLPRVSADQFHASKRVSKKDLKEGDLVFFHTLGKGHRVTHVGVYLYNNRFVHASIAGVQISNLAEGYYMHHYVGAGRVIDSDRTY
jgi:cell wall-associated NlpC family hydrolase